MLLRWIVVIVAKFCEYTKKKHKTELYALKGGITWYVNYISIKLLPKANKQVLTQKFLPRQWLLAEEIPQWCLSMSLYLADWPSRNLLPHHLLLRDHQPLRQHLSFLLTWSQLPSPPNRHTCAVFHSQQLRANKSAHVRTITHAQAFICFCFTRV